LLRRFIAVHLPASDGREAPDGIGLPPFFKKQRRLHRPTRLETAMTDKRLIRALFGFSALALVLAGCDQQQAAAPQPPPPAEVGVVTVEPQSVPITAELPGRTAAYRMAEVRPQVNGIIQKRLFEEGTEVQAGQQLYQIDPAPYQAALDTAKAEQTRAEATVKSARAKAARYRDLVKMKAVSQQDYDDIVATLAENEAAVTSARAAIRTAQINLDYTRVFSPISGRIGRSSVTEGALVTANQSTPLATITQLDPIYVDVTQSSTELLRLRRDIAAGKIQGADDNQAPVNLFLDDAGTAYEHPGQLKFSEVTVNESTGSVRLRAVFPNPRQELLPGLFVRAVVNQGVRQNAFLVPQQAVVRNADGSATVWVVGDDQKAAPHAVTTERAVDDKWLVTSGLEGGDRVVVEGTQRVAPGAQVVAVQLDPGNPSNQSAANIPNAKAQ
jgi:membrane fusion protein (multidrug efflux system)